jgi:hypothetical protein
LKRDQRGIGISNKMKPPQKLGVSDWPNTYIQVGLSGKNVAIRIGEKVRERIKYLENSK